MAINKQQQFPEKYAQQQKINITSESEISRRQGVFGKHTFELICVILLIMRDLVSQTDCPLWLCIWQASLRPGLGRMQRGFSKIQAFSFKQDNEFHKKTVEEWLFFLFHVGEKSKGNFGLLVLKLKALKSITLPECCVF